MPEHDAHPPPGGFPPPGAQPQAVGAPYPAPGMPPPGQPQQPQPYGAPGYGPQGYGTQHPQQWAAPPQQLAPAHKPGAIPLRPLSMSDMYDGAFKIIRANPKAMVGSAVLVTAISMMIPVLVTGLLTLATDVSLAQASASESPTTAEAIGLGGAYVSLLAGSLLQWLGLLFVTGMVSHVVVAAATGGRLSLGEAWAATRGRRWRLVALGALSMGFSLLVIVVLVLAIVALAVAVHPVAAVFFGLVAGLGAVAGLIWVYMRYAYFAVPALMLDGVGVVGALNRAAALVRGQFWRTFGIALLTSLVAQMAGGFLSTPVTIVGMVALFVDPGGAGFFVYILCVSLGTVLASAIVAPFISGVTALQYLDQRMRKEAYDVELIAASGIAVP